MKYLSICLFTLTLSASAHAGGGPWDTFWQGHYVMTDSDHPFFQFDTARAFFNYYLN